MLRLIVIALFICCGTLTAQTTRPTSPPVSRPTSVSRSNVKQWEYLVVSFGKTYFSDPIEDPETKTKGISKLLNYSKAGIVSAQEALLVQMQMDTLGKFGWELVGVIGAIGGDQQMVFRRAYDPDQSKAEATLIREEGERLLAAQRSAREAAPQQATENFIDLDAADRATAIAEVRTKEETRLKAAVETVKSYQILKVTVISDALTPNDSRVKAEVVVDGSAKLLKDGNKYRSSEAQSLAKEVASAISGAAGLRQQYTGTLAYTLGEVKIDISVVVSSQGREKVVATANMGGNWPERFR